MTGRVTKLLGVRRKTGVALAKERTRRKLAKSIETCRERCIKHYKERRNRKETLPAWGREQVGRKKKEAHSFVTLRVFIYRKMPHVHAQVALSGGYSVPRPTRAPRDRVFVLPLRCVLYHRVLFRGSQRHPHFQYYVNLNFLAVHWCRHSNAIRV